MEDRIRVEVDPDLESLVPVFLDNRRADIETLQLALERGDYTSIHRIGHNLKGDSGALGFDGLTVIGRELERAALEQDRASIQTQAQRFEEYMARVVIVAASTQD